MNDPTKGPGITAENSATLVTEFTIMKPSDYSFARSMARLAALGLALSAALPWPVGAADDPNYRMVASFDSAYQGGVQPYMPPVQGRDGQFYGTTLQGGQYGCGTIYQVAPGQPIKRVDAPATDCFPKGLVLAANGRFYGVAFTDNQGSGGSHIFSVAFGRVSSVTSLAAIPAQAHANALPVQGPDGKFYGVADHGGKYGLGLVYVYDPVSNTALTLHDLQQSEGIDPAGSLVFGADGRLYGTTPAGGAAGKGTIFAVTTTGVFTKLYDVPSQMGALENLGSPMTLGADGALYGVALDGGAYDRGAIFRVSFRNTPQGIVTVVNPIFHFRQNSQGTNPVAGLALGGGGALYGVTPQGGSAGGGELYRLVPDQPSSPVKYLYEGLHGFVVAKQVPPAPEDGWTPLYGPVIGTDGGIIGTAMQGGYYYNPPDNAGMIYTYFTMASPVVIPVPGAAIPGQWIGLVGENFSQAATSVKFGDVSATSLRVLSPTYLQVRVPATATTSKIVVTTTVSPGHTYTSATAGIYPVIPQ